jgi:hypothetical protein
VSSLRYATALHIFIVRARSGTVVVQILQAKVWFVFVYLSLAPLFLQPCTRPSRGPPQSLLIVPSIPALDPARLISYG